jgi:hypothetical protein
MARACLAVLLVCLACSAAPPAAAPGRSAAFGTLTLVPREGVSPGHAGSASYGDRRMRDVRFVDYSTPGFAIVFVEAATAPAGAVQLAIESTRYGTRLAPEQAAVGAAGTLGVENRSADAHVLSYPAADLVVRLEPGERREIPVARAGEQGLFLLDVSDAASTVFAAPGPYSVVSSTGEFALRDLEPGARELRAWHPRFPPAVREVVLEPGAALRVDLEIGVGHGAGSGHGAAPEHAHAP